MNIKNNNKKLFKDVHNYTKFKLVEMLIKRLKNNKTKLDDLNSIEDLADEVLKTLSIAGLKFYSELKGEFKDETN
jgi:hypothetical protein